MKQIADQKSNVPQLLRLGLYSTLFIIGFILLVNGLDDGTPNWLDTFLFAFWVAGISRQTDPFVDRLLRQSWLHKLATLFVGIAFSIGILWAFGITGSFGWWQWNETEAQYIITPSPLTLTALLDTLGAIPQVIYSASQNFVSSQEVGTLASFVEYWPLVVFSLAAGFVLTALAIAWRISWRVFFEQLSAKVWQQAKPLILNAYAAFQRFRQTGIWRSLRKLLTLMAVSLLVATIAGAVSTARPTQAKWDAVITSGFPRGRLRTVQTLVLGPDRQDIFAGTSDGVFRSVNNGDSWTAVNNGLPDSIVLSLAVGPDRQSLFAGTSEGVFRSVDNGESWTAVNNGLTTLSISSLVVGPDGQSLFAGTNGGGVFRSVDNGESWIVINNQLTTLSVSSLAVSPDDQSLFAGTDGGGVFRSQDNGESWTAVSNGMTTLAVSSLTTGPDGQSLFAGTFGGGVFRSPDNGESWTAVNNGLTNSTLLTLAVGPEGKSLFAGTNGAGAFRSVDNGESWTAVNNGLADSNVRTFVVGPDGQSLFAGTNGGGASRSVDNGDSWTAINNGLTSSSILSLAIGSDGKSYFAGTFGGGVFRSQDDGESWTAVNNGLTDPNVRSLTMGPDGQNLFAGTDSGGVFRSQDNGESWTAVNNGLTTLSVISLTVGPDGQSLFAGTFIGGAFRSQDNGESWTAVNNGLTDSIVRSLAVGPDGQSLFAGTNGGGVFLSQDNGESWTVSSNGLTDSIVRSLAVGPDGRSLFAGTDGGGVFRSQDDGDSWTAVNNGLTTLPVLSLAVGPDGQSLFAGTNGDGVFRSQDNGESWTVVNNGLTSLAVSSLGVGPDGQSLFAGTFGGGGYRSQDNGESWTTVNSGLTTLPVLSLAVGPDGKSLFAGTNGGGALRSQDNGENWTVVNNGLTTLAVSSLAVGPDGRSLFAGTNGGGVFRSQDNGESWTAVKNGLTALSVSSLAVGPDGRSLFAGTFGAGVFRSQDNGESWTAVNNGLTTLSVSSLAVGPDGRSLFAGTSGGGGFRSQDNGKSWTAETEFPTNLLRPAAIVAGTTMRSGDGNVSFAKEGMGELPCFIYQGQIPQTFQSVPEQHRVILYSSAGAGMMLRTEVPLPFIWRFPTFFLALVAATWRSIHWVEANVAVTLLSAALFGIAFYFYRGVVYANRLNFNQVIWLLPRPRYFLSAAGYKNYADRRAAMPPLEQLLLFQIPAFESASIKHLEEALAASGVAFDNAGLQLAFANLVRRDLLTADSDNWKQKDSALAYLCQLTATSHKLDNLVQQTRQEHPLYIETHQFLTGAGLDLSDAPGGYLATSEAILWRKLSPFYACIIHDRALDMTTFQTLVETVHEIGIELSSEQQMALAIIDRPPRSGDLHQIFAIRAQRGLTIVPLPRSLMTQARLDEQEAERLSAQIQTYMGQANLYSSQTAAVSDVLSFFGRSGILSELKRRLTKGKSLVLFGMRKVGKSSLLYRLREELDWPVAHIDMEWFTSQDNIAVVYEEALHGWRIALQAIYPHIALPSSLKADLAGNETNPSLFFRRAVDEVLTFLNEQPGQRGLLLFLDEMDALYDHPDYLELAGTLRSVAENASWRSRFGLIMAGLNPALNRTDHMQGGRNPFFSFFGEMPLGPLDLEDARAMIISIGGQMGVGYDEDALVLLLEAGGGHPFLTRQLCSAAIQGQERPCRINLAQAEKGIADYLRQPENYLAESLWNIKQGGPKPEEAHLLKILATAQPQSESTLIPKNLSPTKRHAYRQALASLQDRSLAQRSGDDWAISFNFYRRWIRRYILDLEA